MLEWLTWRNFTNLRAPFIVGGLVVSDLAYATHVYAGFSVVTMGEA